jgi:hypothetical protein
LSIYCEQQAVRHSSAASLGCRRPSRLPLRARHTVGVTRKRATRRGQLARLSGSRPSRRQAFKEVSPSSNRSRASVYITHKAGSPVSLRVSHYLFVTHVTGQGRLTRDCCQQTPSATATNSANSTLFESKARPSPSRTQTLNPTRSGTTLPRILPLHPLLLLLPHPKARPPISVETAS